MNFKSLVSACILTGVVTFSSYSQNTIVTGNLKGLKVSSVIFHSEKSDTVKVKKGKFIWKTELKGPKQIYMGTGNKYFRFFAEPGKISITGIGDSTQTYIVKGSAIHDEATAYGNSIKDITDQQSELYKQLSKAEKKEQAELELVIDSLDNVEKKRAEEYIAAHPSGYYSAHLVSSRADYGTDYSEVKRLFNLLDDNVKQSSLGTSLSERLDILKRSALGTQIIDFTQNDTSGSAITFSSLKGKYTLVDFWASWCGPCRAENPNLLAVYNKYKDKNFTVVGISLDDKGDRWKKAIVEDKMPWVQLSDLKGWKNELSTYYGIRGIPSNFLIDPAGKIIAKDLRGGSLHKKLEEILGSSTSILGLSVGDDAPELTYSQWIKGTPVNSLKGKDKIYVLEFWATWCGPCIAAMPHLSELAKKYEKEAVFIGANVWEKTGDKPYESSLPNVTRFVKSSGDRMSYNVIVDNNATELVKNWLTPAGISGIPSTFVIKDGKIAWIGHPIHLDSVIDPIIAGTYDIAAFKKKYEEKASAYLKSDEARKAFSDSLQNYIKTKEFDKALAMLDNKIANDQNMAFVYKLYRFKILLDHFPEKRAIDYAKELNTEKNFIISTSLDIIEKDGLSKESYRYAAEGATQYLKEYQYSGIYDKIAEAYSKAGDNKLAIENQQKAVKLAKEEVRKPEFAGRVFDYTITEYEEKLAVYKKSPKTRKM